VGERLVADVRRDLYRHLLSLDIMFFANRRTGELTSRIASDLDHSVRPEHGSRSLTSSMVDLQVNFANGLMSVVYLPSKH
jgi:ABC-type multidrug transport system fused ATPase/permease subunit